MRGYLSLDVDVSTLEVNQCEAEGYSEKQIVVFHGTHKCHNDTSKVRINSFSRNFSISSLSTLIPVLLQCIYRSFSGSTNWSRGRYQCRCRQGYYSPYHGGVFNGTAVEG